MTHGQSGHASSGLQGFKVERKADRKPFKPKPWSHQDELARLKGKVIFLRFNAGSTSSTISGRLLEADAFTIKIDGSSLPLVISKHAIVFFHEVKEGKAQ